MNRSLLARLSIALLISIAVIFAVQWTLVKVSVGTLMNDYIADELKEDANELLEAISFSDDRKMSLILLHVDPPFTHPKSGRYYQVEADGNQTVRSPSLEQWTLPVTGVAVGKTVVRQVPGFSGEELMVSTTSYEKDGHRLTITVAGSLRHVQSAIGDFLLNYTRLSLLMLALLLILQAVIVRRALSPLVKAKVDVARLLTGETTQLNEAVPAEVFPLVREINRLLTLLAQRLQRARVAIGDLVHGLKGPLTYLTQLSDHPLIQSDPALRASMIDQLEAVRRRIDRELKPARVAGGHQPGPCIDLHMELQPLISTLDRLYSSRELRIDCDVPPDLGFRGDREDLLELCGNILENACKWARRRVSLCVTRTPLLTFDFEDDGPGCSAEDTERIAVRGVRLDEATPGHGLGLAIVQNLVTSYDGQIAFGRSARLGGFRVTVTLPPHFGALAEGAR